MEKVKDITDQEIVDIEEYAKSGKEPPKGCHYRIRIDKEKHTVDVPQMTGRKLLILAGKTPPEGYNIFKKMKGGKPVKIELDEITDFTKPGIERFMTIPLDATEGDPSRRQFHLPEKDEQFLDSQKLPWETVIVNNVRRIIIYDYQIPIGYNQESVNVHLRINGGYPDTQIDMFYFNPPLSRADGLVIKAVSRENYEGNDWQRWSRHRTSANPWRPGMDNLGTHFLLIESCLQAELKKR